jgi:SDR family mycofactocin-dependent oxidoreductase
MGKLDGKVVLITGAARGQGRHHAVRLAAEGADVIAVDVPGAYRAVPYAMATEDDLAETVKEVEALGRRVVSRAADVRDAAALKAAVDEGVAELGRLDALCANAGVCAVRAWDQVTPELWREIVDTNLTGVWNTVVAGAPHLIEAGGGSMALVSSVAGLKGLPFLGPYAAAKHGVVGIMRSMANELARHRIRVNSLHPTGVPTPMAEGAGSPEPLIAEDPLIGPVFMNTLPVRTVEADDISSALLFLVSDESRHVTGMEFKVDAGATNR